MPSVSVRIGSDTSGLETGVQTSKSRLSELRGEIARGTAVAAKFAAGMAAAGAAITAALTVQGLRAADSQAKLARAITGTIDGVRTLQIAASDAGLDGMEASLARLNRRLGAAEAGIGPAAQAVKDLNLDLNALANSDVDERVAMIADAITESGFSSERAARLAQDLGFQQQQAAAFFMQGGDAIRGYRGEVDRLGLSLSQVDATMIENANDSFSRFGMMLDGIRQQLAVQVAPILDAISTQFIDMAAEAGSTANMVERGADRVINGLAMIMNGADRVNVAFKVSGRAIALVLLELERSIKAFALSIYEGPVDALNALINTANRVSRVIGVEFDNIEQPKFIQNMASDVDMLERAAMLAVEDMNEIMSQPLAGDRFKQYVDDARVAARDAAQAMVDEEERNRKERRSGGTVADPEAADNSDLIARLDRVREANLEELELLREKFDLEHEILNEAREKELLTEEEWAEQMRLTKEREEQALTDIEEREAGRRKAIAEAEAANRHRIMGDALRGLTSLMNSESRKMFEIGKVAAISQSLIATYTGMSEALKLGWPLGPIAASAIGASGFANVAAIRSQSFGSGGGGSAPSNTSAINAAQEPVQATTDRSVSIDLSIIGGNDRDNAVAGSIIEQLNSEIEAGGRISRVGLS